MGSFNDDLARAECCELRCRVVARSLIRLFYLKNADLSAKKRIEEMLHSKVPLSRYPWQLGNLSAVVCYCFDSQKNVKWSDVLNLRDKLKRFAPFINGKNTYPTIFELPRSMASARVIDWWLSRNAVLDVLKETAIQNFNADSLAISVSHTSNASAAILSTDGGAVGIDIECSSREIHIVWLNASSTKKISELAHVSITG